MDDSEDLSKRNSRRLNLISPQPPANSIESLLYHATAEELDPLFDRMKLPNSIREKSRQIFQNVFTHGIFSMDPKIPNPEIFAGILYIAVIETSVMKDSDSSGQPSSFPTLTDILSATDVNVNKVLNAVRTVKEKVIFSEQFARHFHDLRQRYLVFSVLFHTFERKCGDVFKRKILENDENEAVASPIRKTEGVDCRKKLCWVLFLLTKYHLLPNSSELYLHFQVLLCCLEYVLSKTPLFLLNSPYASIRFRHDSPCAGESMLEKLAKDFDVNFEETQALHANSTQPFFKGLSDSGDDVDLLFQCDKLCDMYKDIASKPGAINELMFLSYDSLIMPLQVEKVSAPSGSSSLTTGQITPIRGTLTAVHKLEKLIIGLKEGPGEKLVAFFKKCDPDLDDSIGDMVDELKKSFLAAYQSQFEAMSSQHALGQQRLSQGVKLFYKVLECFMIKSSVAAHGVFYHLRFLLSYLLAEEDANSDKSSESRIVSLLKKEVFVKSAFAFSMEIVLATYGQRWDPKTKTLTFGDSVFPFPWILKVMSLQAYKFDIMVENFMSAVDNLFPDVIRYLQNICIQILDKLAWKEGSPLYEALSQNDLRQPVPFASPIKGNNSSTAVNGLDLLLSPAPSSLAADKPSSSSSSSSSSPQDKGSFSLPPPAHRSKSLSAFLAKVNKLGFNRVNSLCSELDLSESIKDMVWTCVDYCLRENFTLLKNRHIDQIIICCIHGMCQALNFNISLETIIDRYKMLPIAKSEDVLPLSPRPKMTWSSPHPCSHLGKPNLTVSPMNNHSMRSPGKFYSSIGNPINPQSPNTFKMINEKMSVKSQSLQQTVKRLNFDDTSQQSSDFKQRKLDSCKLPFS